jgi:hypothetical protein
MVLDPPRRNEESGANDFLLIGPVEFCGWVCVNVCVNGVCTNVGSRRIVLHTRNEGIDRQQQDQVRCERQLHKRKRTEN